MNATSNPNHPGPGYWRNETSGVLIPAVMRYLRHEPLLPGDIGTLGAYLRQWIGAPVWDTNPHADPEGRATLKSLRELAASIHTRADIDYWLALAVEFGVDPL